MGAGVWVCKGEGVSVCVCVCLGECGWDGCMCAGGRECVCVCVCGCVSVCVWQDQSGGFPARTARPIREAIL